MRYGNRSATSMIWPGGYDTRVLRDQHQLLWLRISSTPRPRRSPRDAMVIAPM